MTGRGSAVGCCTQAAEPPRQIGCDTIRADGLAAQLAGHSRAACAGCGAKCPGHQPRFGAFRTGFRLVGLDFGFALALAFGVGLGFGCAGWLAAVTGAGVAPAGLLTAPGLPLLEPLPLLLPPLMDGLPAEELLPPDVVPIDGLPPADKHLARVSGCLAHGHRYLQLRRLPTTACTVRPGLADDCCEVDAEMETGAVPACGVCG